MDTVLDPRDGPTEERAHHSPVVTRESGLGRRAQTRLEKLLYDDFVTPAQAHGGHRFRRDYLIGVIGRHRSSMAMSGCSGGPLDFSSDIRHEAAGRWHAASQELDGKRAPTAVGHAPSKIVIAFLVDEVSFAELGRRIGIKEDAARARLIGFLAVLASHYAHVDEEEGMSDTPHTKEAAMKAILPMDQV